MEHLHLPQNPDLTSTAISPKEAPSHRASGQYLREWLLLVPFPGEELDTDLLAGVGGEANVNPIEGDTVTAPDGTVLTWQRYRSPVDLINFWEQMGLRNNMVVYAFCVLETEAVDEVAFHFWHSGGAKVWLEGKEVYQRSDASDAVTRQVNAFSSVLKPKRNRCLIKLTHKQDLWGFAIQAFPSERVTIQGKITDSDGKALFRAVVRLYQNDQEVALAETDVSGNLLLHVYPADGKCDLVATLPKRRIGNWQLDIPLTAGGHREVNLTLETAVNISGTLLMLDGETPHIGVPVQAVKDRGQGLGVRWTTGGTRNWLPNEPKMTENGDLESKNQKPPLAILIPNPQPLTPVVQTVFSDKRGQYQFVNLKPGDYYIRCHLPTNDLYYGPHDSAIPLNVKAGVAHRNIDFQFADFKKGTWRSYTVFDGLPHQRITAIHQTPAGIMWFGTFQGALCRFDGERFETFSPDEQEVGGVRVNTIHQTADGTLWVGTSSGVYSLQSEIRCEADFVPLFTVETNREDLGVYSIDSTPDGTLWIGVKGEGLYRYDGGELTQFTTADGLISNLVQAVCCTADGRVWCGTEFGASLYNGQSFEQFTTDEGLSDNNVCAICRGADGNIWLGTRDGLSQYDGSTLRTFTPIDGYVIPTDVPNPHVFVRAICQTADGSIWFGMSYGVARFDGERFVNFTDQDELIGTDIRSIYQASDGAIWFATNRGVSRYDCESIHALDSRDGIAGSGVMTVSAMPDASVWAGTTWGGVLRYDGVKFETVVSGYYARAIHRVDDATFYLGTNDGLLRYNGTNIERIPGRNWIMTIDADVDGTLWLGGGWYGGGVSKYDPISETMTTFTTRDGLAHDEVWATVRTPDGKRWFATSGGVSVYDGERFETVTQGNVPTHAVHAVHLRDDSTLWFGTMHGVYQYNGEALKTEDGLIDNKIWCVHSTPDGILWFGTENRGVIGYDGETFTSLDTRDGLTGNFILSITSDEDGSLWFGSYDEPGVTRYRRNLHPPKIYISAVATGGETIVDFSHMPEIAVGSQVTIAYHSIDFKTRPEKRQYRHYIVAESASQEISYGRPTTEKRFDWIPEAPGVYTFSVQAIDRDLNYSAPASVTFTVVPPSHLEVLRQTRQELEQAYQRLSRQNAELQDAKKAAEDAREQAEAANRAKSAFLANMSHEIRTPLNAVLGYAEILRRAENLPSEHRSAVNTILSSGEHLLELINEVLDLSTIEAGRLELQNIDFDLNAMLEEVSAIFVMRCHEKGLQWKVEWPGRYPNSSTRFWVNGDEGKLRQVLINLLSNAVKFTEAGTVTLRIGVRGQGLGGGARQLRRQHGVAVGGEGARERGGGGKTGVRDGDPASALIPNPQPLTPAFTFEVIDTGIGIPAEETARIFEPFQRSKANTGVEGTGLGLAITKKRVELMGGQLHVESEVEKGSRFFFTIPLRQLAAEPRANRAERITLHLSEGCHVNALVVDDVKANRDVLGKLLTDVGVSVELAANGQEALERLRENMPDIVFMDLRMSVMSGLEAARHIWREFGEQAPKIVAVSASTLAHQQSSYLAEGFDAFIGKPFRAQQIYDCMADLLHSIVPPGRDLFQYAETETEETTDLELSRLTLPRNLWEQLKEAAEIYSFTELNEYLDQLSALGVDERQLAQRLRALVEDYDMDAVLAILGEIDHDEQRHEDPHR